MIEEEFKEESIPLSYKMKRILTVIMWIAIGASLNAQEKKVAMLETLTMTEGISVMVKNMVRGELTKSISLEDDFSAFTRVDVDQMMKEHSFQVSGMVNDKQRKKLGQMSGADYVCISKISKDGTAYYIEAQLVEIESGKIENPATGFIESGGLAAVNSTCKQIAKDLVGVSTSTNTIKEKTVSPKKSIIQYLSFKNVNIAYFGNEKLTGKSKIRKFLAPCPKAATIYSQACAVFNIGGTLTRLMTYGVVGVKNKKKEALLQDAANIYNDWQKKQ